MSLALASGTRRITVIPHEYIVVVPARQAFPIATRWATHRPNRRECCRLLSVQTAQEDLCIVPGFFHRTVRVVRIKLARRGTDPRHHRYVLGLRHLVLAYPLGEGHIAVRSAVYLLQSSDYPW